MRKRGRNLADTDVDMIVGMLDGWSGPLSWQGLIDAVEKRLFCGYTRQALSKHDRIAQAFRLSRIRLAEAGAARGPKRALTPTEQALSERLTRREAEVTRLKAENQRLLERHVLWLYNAQARGLTSAELEQPLPPVHRGQTKATLRRAGGG
ncbi:hypothetical protein QRD43_03470 [Pelomonas sp. APW6]|uniref:Transposase n=1 Tax=Roseateles subflavus TaxID=3053353 RepID=A0ABT7LFH1_9BURK|nr:hypothetical protein [Pelomonas sp. APW6]MDL5030955.1 hypothetical protein [Pelomonas sp. APW6]